MKIEKLTRQPLSDSDYLLLFGVANWVFNFNFGFIVEMIDQEHYGASEESWFDLIKLTGGQLKREKAELILNILGQDILNLFTLLVVQRNTIIHSRPSGKIENGFPVALYRKDKLGEDISITPKYLLDFIKNNERLALMIDDIREGRRRKDLSLGN